jgi:hypothetical protein
MIKLSMTMAAATNAPRFIQELAQELTLHVLVLAVAFRVNQ